MSDETTQDDTSTDESPNARRMRERLEALEQENATLMGRVRLSAFKEAGLDPEAAGLNKAIYRTYEGEPDPSAIIEFAKSEYEWEPPAPTANPAFERMDKVREAATTADPATVADKANEAASTGDWVKSGALKDQQLLGLMR